jgi:hypothetical protein
MKGQCVSTNGHQRETIYSVHDKGKGLSRPIHEEEAENKGQTYRGTYTVEHSMRGRRHMSAGRNIGEQLA